VFFCRTESLRYGLAALGAIQLALDAAAAAADYVALTEYSGGDIDRDYLSELARQPSCELQILELDNPGSIRARLRVLRTKEGRAKLLDVLLIASLLLSHLVTPIPALVVAGLSAVNDLVGKDQGVARVAQLQDEVQGLKDQLVAQADVIAALDARVRELESVKKSDVDEAEVEELEVELTMAA
jgi:hypothetical protein